SDELRKTSLLNELEKIVWQRYLMNKLYRRRKPTFFAPSIALFVRHVISPTLVKTKCT
ncbi:hypothetical protein BIW11_07372, partial [Tropilaelaps mercedesae]